MKKLGRIKKVELRDYWKSEASDFTPWLAEEENIKLLGDEIGLELEVQDQEKSVGPFRADILCLDTANDDYVLIENQLEKTDHTHLGQLMTYASGLEAVSIVWIAKKFTEEHRSALDWLNSITDDKFNFFGVEIELYQIGDSLAAPKFELVSKPNEWTRSVKKSAASAKLTETKVLQQEYWEGLKEYLEENGSFMKSHKPSPQHWTNYAIGRSHFHLSATVNTRENINAVGLNIDGPEATENFLSLKEDYEDLSKSEISTKIIWDELENRKMCWVGIQNKDFNGINDRDNWTEQFQWYKETLEAMTKFFKPKIKALK